MLTIYSGVQGRRIDLELLETGRVDPSGGLATPHFHENRGKSGPPETPCYDPAVEVLLAVLLTGVFLQGTPPSTPPSDPAGEALARRIEARQRGLKDLQAHFEQRYRSATLGREIVEVGRLSLKPPGRMLFEYEKPDKKLFVSDGKTSYFYVPDDHQVFVKDLRGEQGVLAVLLSGRQGIVDRFAPALEPSGEGSLKRLRLTPRSADPDVDHVLVDVDAEGRVRGIRIVSPAGDASQFVFESIRENVGLSDRIFQFTPPRGAEVIEG
jgi:outer membrane lipoprotein carrier protein